jgi:hypothetical protein
MDISNAIQQAIADIRREYDERVSSAGLKDPPPFVIERVHRPEGQLVESDGVLSIYENRRMPYADDYDDPAEGTMRRGCYFRTAWFPSIRTGWRVFIPGYQQHWEFSMRYGSRLIIEHWIGRS